MTKIKDLRLASGLSQFCQLFHADRRSSPEVAFKLLNPRGEVGLRVLKRTESRMPASFDRNAAPSSAFLGLRETMFSRAAAKVIVVHWRRGWDCKSTDFTASIALRNKLFKHYQRVFGTEDVNTNSGQFRVHAQGLNPSVSSPTDSIALAPHL